MLAAGTTLGPYKILAPLGAGGMGEVYRARDTRLGRDVAVKVLAAHLAAAPDARARFEREARTISQLNHPHICALYDIGRHEDTDYLVMELLEGGTLAHRLEKGSLPVSEVLSLGAQIADALDRAHRAGVVHRDLKPGNVMLTKSGAKLMDFGLARAALAPVATPESPTMSKPITAEGTIVGTFQYMAPEQLEGKEADARSDIWALGCLLYEMATGKQAFEGQSQASLIAAIMEHEPQPMVERQPLTPPALEHVVKRCLAKGPGERWQSARDAMLELAWVASAGSQVGVAVPIARRKRHRERLAWIGVVAVLAMAAVGPAIRRLVFRPPAPVLVRFAIGAPEGTRVQTDFPSAAVSPDGHWLAFSVIDSAGVPRLWIRALNSVSAQPLAGTENVIFPFWSPDSRFIAFFADGKLRKVAATGGPPETICDAPDARGGGSWSKDGVIVFAPFGSGPLERVSADGGETATVARPDSARGETGLRFPCFLPDGRHFLYVSLPPRHGQFSVYLGSLGSRESPRLMTASSAPVYAEPGYLLFVRNGRLVAQQLDRSRFRLKGRPMSLGDAPALTGYYGMPALCAPARDVLALVTATNPNTRLTWLNRTGRSMGTVPLPLGRYESPSLSPDGRKAVMVRLGSATMGDGDLWCVDLERSVATRLTFDGATSAGFSPWSPDGRQIAIAFCPSGPYDIYQVLASGTRRPEPLLQSTVAIKYPNAWSGDGKYLVYTQLGQATGWDVWLLPLQGERKPLPLLHSRFNEGGGAISPDGRWLTYISDKTGTSEVYVCSFPVPEETYRVSTSGATGAQWSADGREMLLWTGGNAANTFGPVLTLDVQTAPYFRAGVPRVLFTPRPDLAGIVATADLKRFLATVPVEGAASPSITVMLNWQAALKP